MAGLIREIKLLVSIKNVLVFSASIGGGGGGYYDSASTWGDPELVYFDFVKSRFFGIFNRYCFIFHLLGLIYTDTYSNNQQL